MKRLKKSPENIISFASVAIITLLLIVVNLSLDRPYDLDFSNLAIHMREMVNSHAVLIEHWSSGVTTLELDCSSLLAIPVYFITRNIYLSYALSNSINIFLWIYVVYALLKRAEISFGFRMLAIGLIISQWGYGMLDYTNMMFIFGAQYVYKSLIPLLLILIITEPEGGKKWAKLLGIFVYYLLLFVTSLSSGIYVYMCGLMPVLVCTIIYLIINQNPKSTKFIIGHALLSTVIVAIGIVLAKVNNVVPKINTMSLRRIEAVFDGRLSTIESLVELFRPMGSEFYEIGSLHSILHLSRLALVLFVFVFGFANIPKVMGLKNYKSYTESGKETDLSEYICSLLITIFVWNFLVVFLTEAQPRYHIIGAVALMLSSAISADKFFSSDNKTLMPKLVVYIVSLFLLISNGLSFSIARKDYYKSSDDLYTVINSVLEYKSKTDTDTVFIYGAYATNELLRVYSKGIYLACDRNGSVLKESDYYSWAGDKSAFSDRNLLVVGEDFSIYDLPYYIQAAYSEVYANDQCTIYYSDYSPFDGVVGFPILERSVDLPLPCNYTISGTINEYGQLLSDKGGVILHSPAMTLYEGCSYDMRIGYQLESNEVGLWLDIFKDGNVIESLPMDDMNEGVIGYRFTEPGDYHFDIRNETEGLSVNIGYIIFETVN